MTPSDQQREAIPTDPHEWRPQAARPAMRHVPEIRDPILEPFWSGTRVIALFRTEQEGRDEPSLELLDERGEEVSDVAPRAAFALSRAIMAIDAVIDGILTTHATADDTGIAVVPRAERAKGGFLIPRLEVTHAPRKGVTREGPLAFVGLDLLSVDGQQLFDVPLLERKRLLDGLFVQGEFVRISPYTRPPVRPWLRSWKSAGFRGLMMKAANSRYRPGTETSEWVLVERESQA